MNNMRFRSKVDAWIGIALVCSAAVALLAAYVLVSRKEGAGLFGPLVLATVGGGLPLWVLLSTNYVLHDRELLVRSGPFRWRVPISQITRVVPTQSVLSSPALSLDRLRIEYGMGSAVMVSPSDREAFLRAIGEAASTA